MQKTMDADLYMYNVEMSYICNLYKGVGKIQPVFAVGA